MKIIIATSFWIFGLAVILNSIELSLQSEIPRGSRISSPSSIHFGPLPFRKVRCPTDEQVTFETTFLMKDAGGSYVNCTSDKILLAVGPLIIGYILSNVIHPISGRFGREITYNEFTNELTIVSKGYLRENFGVFGPVPEETLRSSVIHPFGMFGPGSPRSPGRARSPTRPNSSTRPSSSRRPSSPIRSNSPERPDSPTILSSPEAPGSPPMVISDFDSIAGSSFDSDSVSSSTSSSSARSSFSRAFSSSSSRSGRPPSNASGSPGKK